MPVKIEGAGWLGDRSEDVSRGTAIASQSRQGTAALPPSRPFAVGCAGFDYFADQQHYGSLAGRIVTGLRQGGRIALVSGDPRIIPLNLAAALTEATAGKHTVLAIACGDDFNEEQLRRAVGPSPLLLFYQADRLSDEQLSRLCSYLVSSGNSPPGVLFGRAGLAARLEKLLRPHPFEDGLVILFNFYELGRDEIEVFIRRQLCAGETADAFSVDAVNWIADLSTGDPAQVNRLSRLILEFVSRAGGTGPAGDRTSEQVARPSAPRWRKAMSRAAQIGILLCLGISVLLELTGGPEFGRMGAPTGSSSDGSLASEQTSTSPQAAATAPASSATAPPPAEPAAAPASTETALPPTEPVTTPASTETALPPTEPVTTPASSETVPPPAEPVAAANSAETEPPPAEPVTAPASTETAPPPAEPATAPASTETAPPPAEPVTAPASTETTSTEAATARDSTPPTEPATAPDSTETAPPPAQPAGSPAFTETVPSSLPTGTIAKRAEIARPLPAEQIAMLLARGDAFMQTRDIASARLLYERAADAGNGRAALRMGESFDPGFLDRIGIYRSIGDRELALSWYRRAHELGDTEAAQLLEKLDPR